MAGAVVVVPTGVANLASVIAAFERLGQSSMVSRDAGRVADARRVVLPGVGTFGAAIRGLREAGLDGVLVDRLHAGRPTLAMCVGLQVLFESSEESPEADGLGVVRARVARFAGDVRVPQFGWNRIEPSSGCRYLAPGYAYFANSYRVLEAPGWQSATAEHGTRFLAGIERGDVVACQFHPELSGAYGRDLLERWLEGAG